MLHRLHNLLSLWRHLGPFYHIKFIFTRVSLEYAPIKQMIAPGILPAHQKQIKRPLTSVCIVTYGHTSCIIVHIVPHSITNSFQTWHHKGCYARLQRNSHRPIHERNAASCHGCAAITGTLAVQCFEHEDMDKSLSFPLFIRIRPSCLFQQFTQLPRQDGMTQHFL